MIVKIMDGILDAMEDIVAGLIAVAVVTGIAITFPIWIIPYAVVRRRKND